MHAHKIYQSVCVLGGGGAGPQKDTLVHRGWFISSGVEVVLPGCSTDRLCVLTNFMSRVGARTGPELSGGGGGGGGAHTVTTGLLREFGYSQTPKTNRVWASPGAELISWEGSSGHGTSRLAATLTRRNGVSDGRHSFTRGSVRGRRPGGDSDPAGGEATETRGRVFERERRKKKTLVMFFRDQNGGGVGSAQQLRVGSAHGPLHCHQPGGVVNFTEVNQRGMDEYFFL